MEFIIQHSTLIFLLACMCGFFMAWGIGANDVANAMGTSVGSKALTFKQAIILAVVFEFAGAFLAGGEVTNTVRKGILDMEVISASGPESSAEMVYGMLGALLAAGTWLLIASWRGWPVSTTHSIVGSIVGFGVVAFGMESVKWAKVGSIVMSWVVSPLLAGTIGFMLFKSVKKLIITQRNPFEAARKTLPFYMFLVGFVIVLVTVHKGLKHILPDSAMDWNTSLLYAVGGGIVVAAFGTMGLRKINNVPEMRGGVKFDGVEKICGYMMIFTACSMAFAHGSNDVANAVGPMAAIIGTIEQVQPGGAIGSTSQRWVLLVGGIGIAIGLGTFGYRVIRTIGEKITVLTPSRGFSAELAAAATVVLASGQGWPVSTTHTLVGAVLGVGLARSHKELDFKVLGKIGISWVVTLPVGAGLTVIFFYMFRAWLGGG